MIGWLIMFIAVFCGVMYLLYREGIAVFKRITAILFVFRPGKFKDRATLDSCTGWIWHIGRFGESRSYEFVFDAQLSKGNAEVLLLDKKKQQLLKLNNNSPSGRMELDGKSRYYIRWEFRNATGKCELHW